LNVVGRDTTAARRQPDLARDYATMRPMFMSEPPDFDTLMLALAGAQAAINKL